MPDLVLTHVVEVERVRDFVLRIRFSNRGRGERDFSGLVQEPGPMVEPLRDKTYFDRVFIDWGALTWPNGFDLDPTNLHYMMLTAGELQRRAGD